MDRGIVYPGSIPLDTDLLNTNRNTMVAIGALASATLGTVPAIDGLTVTPSAQGGLAVDVAPGSITAYVPLDQTAYGSLPADLNNAVVQTGINIGLATLPLSAPPRPAMPSPTWSRPHSRKRTPMRRCCRTIMRPTRRSRSWAQTTPPPRSQPYARNAWR
jgi:hypothetical protein